MTDDIDTEDEIFDDYETEEEIKENNSNIDNKIEVLDKQIKELEQNVTRKSFPRSENKTDFASSVINTDTTKKICNLEDEDIDMLVEKRRFFNFLNSYGWDRLASRVIKNIEDIEDYSLSRKAKLLDSVFIERAKQEAKNIQEERRYKR